MFAIIIFAFIICKIMRCIIWSFVFVVMAVACNSTVEENIVTDTNTGEERTLPAILNDTLTELTELRRGDILVKPNHNWLPGTAWVKGGSDFGHAMIVTKGATGENAIEVLSQSVIIESHARSVPPEFEIRMTKAYNPDTDYRFDNTSFAPAKAGYRYRLRPQLPDEQIDSVLAFIIRQEDGLSSWRAQKNYVGHAELTNTNHQTYWYCSHLIWQAFYTVLNIDLDPNGGVIVYPNDLVASPFFQNDQSNPVQRVRF
jgi:hypothetical protein